MDDLRDSAAFQFYIISRGLVEDSAIHCIGFGDDMNAFSSVFTDFRVSEVKSL